MTSSSVAIVFKILYEHKSPHGIYYVFVGKRYPPPYLSVIHELVNESEGNVMCHRDIVFVAFNVGRVGGRLVGYKEPRVQSSGLSEDEGKVPEERHEDTYHAVGWQRQCPPFRRIVRDV